SLTTLIDGLREREGQRIELKQRLQQIVHEIGLEQTRQSKAVALASENAFKDFMANNTVRGGRVDGPSRRAFATKQVEARERLAALLREYIEEIRMSPTCDEVPGARTVFIRVQHTPGTKGVEAMQLHYRERGRKKVSREVVRE